MSILNSYGARRTIAGAMIMVTAVPFGMSIGSGNHGMAAVLFVLLILVLGINSWDIYKSGKSESPE